MWARESARCVRRRAVGIREGRREGRVVRLTMDGSGLVCSLGAKLLWYSISRGGGRRSRDIYASCTSHASCELQDGKSNCVKRNDPNDGGLKRRLRCDWKRMAKWVKRRIRLAEICPPPCSI